MTVSVATTRVACDTSTGTQDITISGFGTPKAALFICGYGVTDGTAADHWQFSIGAATGTANEWCMSVASEHNVPNTDNGHTTDSDRVVKLNVEGTATVLGEAEFTAFITDGVRINWLDAMPSAYLLQVVLFGGTDLSAHANNIDLADTTDNAVDVTDPGFEPDLVIAVAGNGMNVDVASPTAEPSYGMIHNGVSVTQKSWAWRNPSNEATAQLDSRLSSNRGILAIDSSAVEDWSGEFGTFDSSGFTVTTRTAGANNTDLMYLALAFNGATNVWVDTFTTPTSTGNDAQTGPGFTPQIVFGFGTYAEAVDTSYNDSNLSGSFGFFAFDDSSEFMTSVNSENGPTTMNTQSLSDNTAIELPDHDGTAGLTASFVSFDANGWTLNFSAVEANAKQFIGVAIEEIAAPTGQFMTTNRGYW